MAINVVLEVLTGPELGRKIRLGAQQIVTVGRTERSDFVHRNDPKMSAQHFTLETDSRGCHLVDLESVNGTFVNDEKITRADLFDGDRIRAADTNFVVHISGGVATNPATPPIAKKSPTLPPGVLPTIVQFKKQKCRSELLMYQGVTSQVPAVEIARRLTMYFPLWIIADFDKLELKPPPELLKPEHLFDWLPEAAAAQSPVVLSRADVADPFSLIDQGWGKAGLSCWFTREERPTLLAHLRKIAKVSNDSVLGYCWPSVLVTIMANCPPEFVHRIMEGIETILVEPAEEPDNWRIYTFNPLDDMLKQLGFVAAAADPAAANGESTHEGAA